MYGRSLYHPGCTIVCIITKVKFENKEANPPMKKPILTILTGYLNAITWINCGPYMILQETISARFKVFEIRRSKTPFIIFLKSWLPKMKSTDATKWGWLEEGLGAGNGVDDLSDISRELYSSRWILCSYLS